MITTGVSQTIFTVITDASGQYQFTQVDLTTRLEALQKATRATHWIYPDLRTQAMSSCMMCFTCCIPYCGPGNKETAVAQEVLTKLNPQILASNNGALQALYTNACSHFEANIAAYYPASSYSSPSASASAGGDPIKNNLRAAGMIAGSPTPSVFVQSVSLKPSPTPDPATAQSPTSRSVVDPLSPRPLDSAVPIPIAVSPTGSQSDVATATASSPAITSAPTATTPVAIVPNKPPLTVAIPPANPSVLSRYDGVLPA